MNILVVMLMFHGQPYNRFFPITDHDYLNLTYCLEYRNRARDRWENEPGVEIIYIDCP